MKVAIKVGKMVKDENGPHEAGDVIEVSAEDAASLIADGIAEAVKETKPEPKK